MSAATYTIQGRALTMPVEVRVARSWAGVFSVNAAAAQRVVDPTGLKVIRTRPGRSLVTLVVADYVDGDLDAYHEAGISFLVHPHDRARATDLMANRACVYIHQLPVDQRFTLEAGREIWGYPKWLAGIGLATADGRTTCALSDRGAEVFTLTVHEGGIRMPRQAPPTYTFLDGVLRRTEWGVGGMPRGRLRGADVHLGTHPIADELRALGVKRRALFAQTNLTFSATFGPPEIVQA